jgi:hypothetical protein
MTLNQLEATATWKGNQIHVTGRDWMTHNPIRSNFHEITHYFNEKMEEIGMIAVWNKDPLIFDKPRIWWEGYLTPEKINLRKIFH